jgi:purine-binding chemotaxis protein CheW
MATTEQVSTLQDLAGKYLTFKIQDETYGLRILKVQEIIGMQNVTRVPRTPRSIRGVINLRGKVIPVVDLRVKFDLDTKDDSEKTCIIVVKIEFGGRVTTMGIIVDEVTEVSDISVDKIESTPSFGAAVDTECILAMAKLGKAVVTLLDIDKILSTSEVVAAHQAREGIEAASDDGDAPEN